MATPDDGTLPEEAYAAALASLPGVGPKTLRALLDSTPPQTAWQALLAGRTAPLGRPAPVVRAARATDVAEVWKRHRRAGIGVSVLGRAGYPAALAKDPEAPAVLFSLGDPSVVDRHPRVAIVGTRSATRYGLGVAAQLGAELAAAGVVVASGLALGIDGAAHEGSYAAWHTVQATSSAASIGPNAGPPVAVVAGAVDAPYPRQHTGLWWRVAEAGAVLSESPADSADGGWRFPMRNRIIAALADVVVVVECHARGGSLHTVQAAAKRGIPVGAVPGSVRSPASAGTNALLADGCFVVRDVSDVLVAVGLATASLPIRRPEGCGGERVEEGIAESEVEQSADDADDGSQEEDPVLAIVLDAIGWERCSLEDVLARSGLALDVAAGALERLRAQGRLHGVGGWWERA